jgi:uncharacterized membrane protein YgcG
MRFSLIFVLAACAAPEEAPTPVVRFDLDDKSVSDPDRVIDLTAVDGLYMVDKRTGGYDPSRIRIICPNGVEMWLDTWIAAQRSIYGFDVTRSDNDRFFLTGFPAIAAELLPVPTIALSCEDCDYSCFTCTDGAVVCTSSCTPHEENDLCLEVTAEDPVQPQLYTWPELPEEEDPTPGWTDPLPDPDPDGGSSGGGGGSGGSSGSSSGSSSSSSSSGGNTFGNTTPVQ